MTRTLLLAIWLTMIAFPGAMGAARVGAQGTPVVLADAPSFDVASVKPSAPDVQSPGIRPMQGARVTVVGLTLRELVQIAYGSDGMLLRTQVVGGPEWLDRERFDIVASSDHLVGPAPTFDTTRALLQSLLQERFGAKVHVDKRDLPIYALVMARQDRRLGPQLRPPSLCAPSGTITAAAGTPNCGFQRAPQGRKSARSIPMSLLSTNLASLPDVGRVVHDRTGLQGVFDVELTFTPQTSTAGQGADSAPDIFTALQEQLGLRLESDRGAVDVIVIDSVGRPTPD